MHLTIAYITNRAECKVEWFLKSLNIETGGDFKGITVVAVDYHAGTSWRLNRFKKLLNAEFIHCKPKPTVWQGEHRLTTRDYFAAANARNTALCYAEDGYICYVDDLTVLVPGWLKCVREAMEHNWVACGSYMKVKELRVAKGVIAGFRGYDGKSERTPENLFKCAMEGYPGGVDTRADQVPDWEPHVAGGSWMFGCSCAMPVKALLDINGWDEDNDSMGGEDYAAGIMMEYAGYHFRYMKRMMTLESEELHGNKDDLCLRIIKGEPGPTDSSWKMLNSLKSGARKVSPGYWGEGGITKLREKILNGENFPIMQNPQHDWRDGQPLIEM